ncbi:3-isopropylmalate dehydrogenase [Aquisalinus flavus]|uniref:3-isopropylmalate dehydrogenase n=1 Tax=Aquisalinus flavus TaxID=1526572 RepID=A0A8J2V5L1_9PROT|nr:3-isopropylmalate dehydrogenase [Aquisalinus flavus]MBD0427748.1 3-isopropylmalate dehydrogenase [Aquisalinus flavus]UNE47523.1 3-isopropylmalate dehydrogenase [Aquisalinus flavus]GGD03509.1 3-isopropylmalate dehydrogenase [Aquisalinus flavus]
MTRRIVRMAGDGIGPEIMTAAGRVLDAAAEKFRLDLSFQDCLFGGVAVDETGTPFPADTESACKAADAVLLGAVGGPQYDSLPPEQRPEKGLLAMRKALGVYANIRPVRNIPALAGRTAFRDGHLDGVDIVVIRELTGGIYFGAKDRGDDWATDECRYTTSEIERIVRRAGDMARQRKGRVTSVDKSNVLMTSKLWREVTTRVMAEEYPDVTLDHMLVDAMAMKLISSPADFDVIVTENMFGDILTDEASMLVGSIGVLPSASMGDDGPGVFEPIHGSAPDIAGQGKANPIGMIASIAMMLETGLGEPETAAAITAAIDAAIEAGDVTGDLGGALSTDAAADAIARRV